MPRLWQTSPTDSGLADGGGLPTATAVPGSFSVLTWNLQAAQTRDANDGSDASALEDALKLIIEPRLLGVPFGAAPLDVICLQELQAYGKKCSYCRKRKARAAGQPGRPMPPCREHDHTAIAMSRLSSAGYVGRLHHGTMNNTVGVFWRRGTFDLVRTCFRTFAPPSGKGLVALVLRHSTSWQPLVVATTHTSVPLDKAGRFAPARVLAEVSQALGKLEVFST